MSVVYLNGEYLPLEEAKVSVLDRGFLFADGVYEVIPAYGSRLLRLQEHMDRLQTNLNAIRLDNPLSIEEWNEIFAKLLTDNPSEDQSIYLQVTRGVAAKRDHGFPEVVTQTVFIMVNKIKAVNKEELRPGISAVTLDDIRWKACNIKSISLLGNILLRQQAHDQNAAEAILINDGKAVEGAASNVFIVKDGVIITPPTSSCLLPGITRDLILELAEKYQFKYKVRDIAENELFSADEIWLTSSTKEIMPVLKLNAKAVANGQSGPIWERMIDVYQAYKADFRHGHAQ